MYRAAGAYYAGCLIALVFEHRPQQCFDEIQLILQGRFAEGVLPQQIAVHGRHGYVGHDQVIKPHDRPRLEAGIPEHRNGIALDLRIRLRGLGQEFGARCFLTPRYGIGIDSTHKTVGFCGTPGRFFFTAVGGNGDLASRRAFANLGFGSDLLLGPAAFRLVRDRFEVRPMEMVYDPVGCCLQEIYQILSLAGVLSEEERARRDHFWRGVVLLREKEIDAALEAFSRARVSGAEDGPLAYFLAKAQDGVAIPESRPLRLVRDLTEEGHARLIDRV